MTRLTILGVVLLGGCSLATMRGTAPSDGRTYPICSDRIAPWIVDSLASAAVGLATASAASEGEATAAVGLGTGAAVLATSAVYGMVTSSRCRASRARYVEPQPAYRLDVHASPPPKLPPPTASPATLE